MLNRKLFLFLNTLIWFSVSLTHAAEPVGTYIQACEPFGAVEFLSTDKKNLTYPEIWTEVLTNIERVHLEKEKKDVDIKTRQKDVTQQIVNEYLVAALLYGDDLEFGLGATATGTQNLKKLLAVVPAEHRKDLPQNQACAVLTLANRAIDRLVESEQYYTTIGGQRRVREFIEKISTQAERLLKGEGSYKLSKTSTAEERKPVIKAHMLETLRQLSQEFPEHVTFEYISKTALEISGIKEPKALNINDPLDQQKIAAAYISALTISLTTQGQGKRAFYGSAVKDKQVFVGQFYPKDTKWIVEDLNEAFSNTEIHKFLKENQISLYNEVDQILSEVDENSPFHSFLRYHYAYQSAKKKGSRVVSSTFSVGANEIFFEKYIENLRRGFPLDLEKNTVPHVAFAHGAFDFFVRVKALSREDAQRFITVLKTDYEINQPPPFLPLAQLLRQPITEDDLHPVQIIKQLYEEIKESKVLKKRTRVEQYEPIIQAFYHLYQSKSGDHEAKLQEAFADMDAFLREYDLDKPESIKKPLVLRAALAWFKVLLEKTGSRLEFPYVRLGFVSKSLQEIIEDRNHRVYLSDSDLDRIIARTHQKKPIGKKAIDLDFSKNPISSIDKKGLKRIMRCTQSCRFLEKSPVELIRTFVNKKYIATDDLALEILLVVLMNDPEKVIKAYLS